MELAKVARQFSLLTVGCKQRVEHRLRSSFNVLRRLACSNGFAFLFGTTLLVGGASFFGYGPSISEGAWAVIDEDMKGGERTISSSWESVSRSDRVGIRAYAPNAKSSRAYAPDNRQTFAPSNSLSSNGITGSEETDVAPVPLSTITQSSATPVSSSSNGPETFREAFVPNSSSFRAYTQTSLEPQALNALTSNSFQKDVLNCFRPENPLVPYCNFESGVISHVSYETRSGSVQQSLENRDESRFSSLLGELDREKARFARSVRDSVLYIDAIKGGKDKNDCVHGSGCLVQYRDRVFVVTNNHISSGVKKCEDIVITTSKGSRFKPCAVYSCPDFDIDALEIAPDELSKYPELCLCHIVSSSCLEPGYGAFTIGSPLFMDGTLTYCSIGCLYRDTSELKSAGIIKEKEVGKKELVRYIQLNGVILEGNSGGPLFTSHGEIVGIVTASVQLDSCATGVGFAIPIEDALSVIRKMVDSGCWTRSYLGVVLNSNESLEDVRDKGIELTTVESGSPAELAGLRTGDYIYTFNGVRVKSSFDLARMIAISSPEEIGALKIFREGRLLDVQFKTMQNTKPTPLKSNVYTSSTTLRR